MDETLESDNKKQILPGARLPFSLAFHCRIEVLSLKDLYDDTSTKQRSALKKCHFSSSVDYQSEKSSIESDKIIDFADSILDSRREVLACLGLPPVAIARLF